MALTERAGSLLLGGHRSIMGLFADVVIEENLSDELVITEHPVEKGSPISDHCYKAPPEVTMKIGWSESAGRMNGLIGNYIYRVRFVTSWYLSGVAGLTRSTTYYF